MRPLLMPACMHASLLPVYIVYCISMYLWSPLEFLASVLQDCAYRFPRIGHSFCLLSSRMNH